MITMLMKCNKVLLVSIVGLGVLLPATAAGAQEVSSEQVAAAIQKGVALLRQQQRADGSWPDSRGYKGGVTALALLALLNAGVPANDPAVSRGLDALQRTPNERTYVVGLKCQVFAASKLAKYRRHLADAATWLARSQNANGMWSYGSWRRRGRRMIIGRGDNSNTQFALLGLHEAAKAGVHIPKEVWARSRKHFENTQLPDGGWTYYYIRPAGRMRQRRLSYGSMTAAGVASLYICGQRLHVGGRRQFVNGVYPDCGKYRQNVVLAAGLKWLTKNFSVRENPGRRSGWLHYYLYGLERVGMISGRRSFGPNDWYRQGAALLVATQNAQGGWGRSTYDTPFAILFLAKGNRPVLIQKLQWDGSWNRNIHDLENLTAWIDDKLGKRTTWQTTTLQLPLRELRQSPILFITGHDFPEFTEQETVKLRRFVQTGGTLLFEACCGRNNFKNRFAVWAKKAFGEYPVRKLGLSHPVFSSFFKLKDTYNLEGIDQGCRTSVFFSPRALSCLWELQTIRPWSERAFKLGTNIAAYATGREQLPDKLDAVELPAQADRADQPAEVPRGAVRIARLIHEGDYNSDPHCMTNLASILRDKAKIDVVAKARLLRPTDEKIYEYPIVFMHGHFSFRYNEKQIAALRKYLDRGGILIADACCGRKAFDKSFREMVSQLYPKEQLKRLPKDHPVYTGKVGPMLGELRYRKILSKQLKSRGTTRPPIEAVSVEGRILILYSKYDFTCALEGDRPYSCRGYIDADGRKLAMNLFLYAICY